MEFSDRTQAAELLAAKLQRYRDDHPLILGIPRGAIPMGSLIASRLGGDLDVVLVHKIGAPGNPEFAIGSITEYGDLFMSNGIERYGIPEAYIRKTAAHELDRLRQRRASWSPIRPALDPAGRTAIVVDDGIATGSTMLAALRSIRSRGPRRLVVAAPVASDSAVKRLSAEADELVILDVPADLQAISQYYVDFSEVTDEDVVRALGGGEPPSPASAVDRSVWIELPEKRARGLPGELALPASAKGMVVFAHGSGSSRRSPRNRGVARALNRAGFGTLLFDLLTEEEASDRALLFDIPLLAGRLALATRWLRSQADPPEGRTLPVGFFGASTGAGAALWAAPELGGAIRAIVSRGGRPDLALPRLGEVTAPTLLLVGGEDGPVIELNQEALRHLRRAPARLEIIPGATHLFEEPGKLGEVAVHAISWFERHLARKPAAEDGQPGRDAA